MGKWVDISDIEGHQGIMLCAVLYNIISINHPNYSTMVFHGVFTILYNVIIVKHIEALWQQSRHGTYRYQSETIMMIMIMIMGITIITGNKILADEKPKIDTIT